jgi:hypothetical protein
MDGVVVWCGITAGTVQDDPGTAGMLIQEF